MRIPAGELVRVEYTKYDGRAHRSYPALRLGVDEHGTWLGVPGGDFIEAATEATFKYEDPYVLLVPRQAWWTAMFNAPPRRTEIYCDIATPARWIGDHVVLADLDLDVRRRRADGVVELLDEDEFATHSEQFGYPDFVVSEAWAAARWLVEALDDGTEPFATGFHQWLQKVR
jgi:uncharacterized protein